MTTEMDEATAEMKEEYRELFKDYTPEQWQVVRLLADHIGVGCLETTRECVDNKVLREVFLTAFLQALSFTALSWSELADEVLGTE